MLARQLRHLDTVNIGAAGTFVVRQSVTQAQLRVELERRLPFDTEIMICQGRDIVRLTAQDFFAGHAARQIGMQFYDTTHAMLGLDGASAEDFAAYLHAMSEAMGDGPEPREEAGAIVIEHTACRILRGLADPSPAIFDAWSQLWQGACATHDRALSLTAEPARLTESGAWRWRITVRT